MISEKRMERWLERKRLQSGRRYDLGPHKTEFGECLAGETVPAFTPAGHGFAAIRPRSMSICKIGPGYTWRRLSGNKRLRSELTLHARLEIARERRQAALEYARQQTREEAREYLIHNTKIHVAARR